MLPKSFEVTLASMHLTLVADVGFDHLPALADLAEEGIHDPARQPFGSAWTDCDPVARRTRLARHLDGCWKDWSPEEWNCPFTILHEGRPIGVQMLSGRNFGVLREVRTGSWIGREFQGRGYGTEARRMVLDLAFGSAVAGGRGLGAKYATTSAHTDNRRAIAVNRKLGYQWNGTDREIVRGEPMKVLRYRLGVTSYLRHVHPLGITRVTGLESNREWFGATA